MKFAFQLYLLCFVMICLPAGCTYGEEQSRSVIMSGRLSTDSSIFYTVVHTTRYREAKGLAAFPDGGRDVILAQELKIFKLDVAPGTVSLVQNFSVPDTVWVACTPHIWSVLPDGVYILLTGCPKGGECYGPQNRREFYYIDVGNRLREVPAPPEPARNTEPKIRTFSIYSDRIELRTMGRERDEYHVGLDLQKGDLFVRRIVQP